MLRERKPIVLFRSERNPFKYYDLSKRLQIKDKILDYLDAYNKGKDKKTKSSILI